MWKNSNKFNVSDQDRFLVYPLLYQGLAGRRSRIGQERGISMLEKEEDGKCECDLPGSTGVCSENESGYEDGYFRMHREMIKKMDEFEHACRARLDATVMVYSGEKFSQEFLKGLIPLDEYRPHLDSGEILEFIRTLEATLEMIKIAEEFNPGTSRFLLWSRRHAA